MLLDLRNALLSKTSWKKLGQYLGLGTRLGKRAVVDLATLQKFIESRASHVGQTSLYGYMKTRAGTRFPEMFENPAILESINIAKWQVWLACVSDLSIYMGALLSQRTGKDEEVRALLALMANRIVAQAGFPEDAGEQFEDSCQAYLERIANARYDHIPDDHTAFTESPKALVYWSPIADNLKRRDEEIVENSIRFRWIEVRRSARQLLLAESVLANGDNPATATT